MKLGDTPVDTSQIEDRRGIPGGGLAIGGGLGVVGLIITVLVNVLGGGNGRTFDVGTGLDNLGRASQASARPLDSTSLDPTTTFVGKVVNNVQATWAGIFRESGQTYQTTKIVLFETATRTGCGNASTDVGPFYCPADRKVYLALSFFQELRSKYGAPGDFAQAYVIAHEFGHHVQTLLGIEPQVRRAQQQKPQDQNELSVRMELQADCFAGVWAHSAYRQGNLEAGDVDEGLTAAAAVGDDRLQRQATGRVNPEAFTHGTSEQRKHWFSEGYRDGSVDSCDTFKHDI